MTRRSTFLQLLRIEARAALYALVLFLLVPTLHGIAEAHDFESGPTVGICKSLDRDYAVPGVTSAGHDCTLCAPLTFEPSPIAELGAASLSLYSGFFVAQFHGANGRPARLTPPSHAPPVLG